MTEKTAAVLTGPIQGSVTLADGTEIDVSSDLVMVTPEQAAEVADLIGKRYASEGHPTDPDFTYDGPESSTEKKD